jgi:hypothetical protein
MTTQFTGDEKLLILAVKDKIKDSILDFRLTMEKLGQKYEKGFFVSGGCVGSLLRGEPVNDFDIYFRTKEIGERVKQLYTEDDSYKNYVETHNEKYRDVAGHPSGLMVTENAVTLKNKIQLITKHYGTPAEIRKTFDFTHCLPYYDTMTDFVYISREQYDLNMQKKMKINCQESYSSFRELKFKERGWTWR